jgi:serine/threonine protein kinase
VALLYDLTHRGTVATANPLNEPASNSSNVLGKFKLIAELGRGGMSEVYLAVIAGPAGFNKLVVVKLIKGDLAEDPDFISMFLEEARLSARLSHPNIVQTNEVGEFGGRYYIAMEYLEGQAYSRILHRLGRDRGLPLGMSLRILTEVLQGLHYAHELADFDGTALSVVHRDVTPHNVFVTYDGQVKVVDFGIAKAMNSSHETRTGMLKGKVGYMAPEQAKGERVDRRADIFSVGVMLWEAAVGKRLWKGLNEVQILHQLLAGDIPSPRAMRPDISPRLEQIIMKAVAVDRDQRHSSSLELMGELEDLMDSGSERATLREVGRLLSSTFEEERRKLKGIIEQQVAKSSMLATGLYQQVALPYVEQPAVTGELPRLSMGPVSGSIGSHGQGFPGSYSQQSHVGSQPSHPSASIPSAAGSNPGYARGTGSHPMSAQSAPMVPSFSGSYPGAGHPSASHPSVSHANMSHPNMSQGGYPGASYPGASHHGAPHLAGPATGSLPQLGPPMTGSEPGHSSQPSFSNSINHASVASQRLKPASNNRLTLVALGVAAAAGGAAALLYVAFARPPAASAPEPAASGTTAAPITTTAPAPILPETTTPTPAASADVAPKASKILVKASPDTAEVFVDGKKVGDKGRYEGTIPNDGAEHEVKVDAPGYASKAKTVKPGEELNWEPELTPNRSGASPAPKTATPTETTPPPPPTATSTGEKRDKNGRVIRPIETAYPGG